MTRLHPMLDAVSKALHSPRCIPEECPEDLNGVDDFDSRKSSDIR